MQTNGINLVLRGIIASPAIHLPERVRLATLLLSDPSPPDSAIADALKLRPLELHAFRQTTALEEDPTVLTILDPLYPALLREMDAPPLALHVDGDASSLRDPCVAIVGSRDATRYGLNVARMLAGALARAGVTVVSGFARGIDAAAHAAAIEAGGRTVAVLGTGLAIDYPRGNRTLRRQLRSSGALVSEFAHHTPPRPQNFPIRNRIIAGLSRAVIVVEAGLRSGSLVTARLAMEQNRDVLAVPGSILSHTADGCHRLIQQGAKLVSTIDDVFDELNLPRVADSLAPLSLTADATRVLDILDMEKGLHADQISERLGWNPSRLATALLELELTSAVTREAGGMITRAVRLT